VEIFSDTIRTGCGVASSAVGPFYCPADQRVYLDLKFFDELQQRFHAPGDFAVAYVIAHEVGHHVQYLLGISEKVQRMQQQSGKIEGNRISVRLELQADFLAGVWAHHAQRTKQILEAGDIEEALNAAAAVGDNAIQKQVTGHVTPDAFTHGTSEQRTYWFKRGFETGDLSIMNQLFGLDYEKL
jgi:predicted metalloprotease